MPQDQPIETALKKIVAEQTASGLTPLEYYTALARLAHCTCLLRAAIIPSTYTTLIPNPVDKTPPLESFPKP